MRFFAAGLKKSSDPKIKKRKKVFDFFFILMLKQKINRLRKTLKKPKKAPLNFYKAPQG